MQGYDKNKNPLVLSVSADCTKISENSPEKKHTLSTRGMSRTVFSVAVHEDWIGHFLIFRDVFGLFAGFLVLFRARHSYLVMFGSFFV